MKSYIPFLSCLFLQALTSPPTTNLTSLGWRTSRNPTPSATNSCCYIRLLPYLYVSHPLQPQAHLPTYAEVVSRIPPEPTLSNTHHLALGHYSTSIPPILYTSLESYITPLFTKARKAHLLSPTLLSLVCTARQSSTLSRYLAYHKPWVHFAISRKISPIPIWRPVITRRLQPVQGVLLPPSSAA